MQKYFIKTFGCQMNVSDSERIAGLLEMQKFKPADDIKKAGLVVFNTCGVRQMAEDRVYGQIHNLRKKNPKIKIILTGCLSNRKDVQRKLKDKVDLFCEIKYFPKSLFAFMSFPPASPKLQPASTSRGRGKRGERGERKRESRFRVKPGMTNNKILCRDYLLITPKYTNKHTAFVPIMTGCNNFCSYCVVPYARGREISRPVEEIILEIETLAENGCEEIILLGQNVNSYFYETPPRLSFPQKRGSSEETKFNDWIPAFLPRRPASPNRGKQAGAGMTKINFPNLLNSLAKSFPQTNFKFLTSHPKDFSENLIKVVAKNKNISREIHLPIQSGSDKILKAMNRPYTQKKYLDLIQKIKKKIPNTTFTTDVIVGFPGETEKDFENSVKVFKKVNYDEAYINKYSPRPGTAAWKFGDPISWEEKKRREKILRNIIKDK